MAKVDTITQMIRNAQAAAIAKNGGITANNGAAFEADTKSILQKQIAQQQSAKKETSGQAETPALREVKDTRTTQQKHDDAKKVYDDYVGSDEHKQRLAEANRTALEESMRQIFSTPGMSVSDALIGAGQKVPTDSKEQELKAMVDHYKQQMDQEESQRIRDADMKEIESWSDEDREQLRQYISSENKTNNLFVNSNPLLWFGANKALGDSAKYLYGKYGEEKTKQLASSYSRYLNEEEARKIQEDTKEAVNRSTMSAIGHNILGVGTRLFGGLQATADRFGEALDRDERYPTLAPFVSGDLMSLHGNTVTAQTAQNIAGEDGGILRQGAAYLYQGGMTMVDSFARAAAGGGAGGAAALAACNAFSQTVSDASRQGATPEQAYTLGAAVAGVEYLSEKIPMERVFKLAKAGDTKVLAQAFKQAGIEISTEELSLLGSMAAEAAILQEKSSYKQQIGDLVAGGASYEDAKAQADKAVWEEVKQTAYISGFAGIFSGGGAAIVGKLATNNAPEVAEDVQQEQSVQAPPEAPVVDEGQQIVDAVAAELAQQAPQTEPAAPLTEAQKQMEAGVAATLDEVLGKVGESQTGASNSMAEAVMQDAEALDALIRATGAKITGSKAEQRRAVKDALNRMFNNPGGESVDSGAVPSYNNTRSEQVQGTIDRLNVGGDSIPSIDEILAIPEIAEAEKANDGPATIDLPNREQIREEGYRKAMQKGSWNGTDYTGEVQQGRRMDIVIGLPGSGKTSVYTERLSQEHKNRVIDTDDFREYIPEYNGSNASIVHEESSEIRDRVFDTALDNGDNILLSTIGANAEKLAAQIAAYKEDGYQVYLHLNELPNNKSLARAIGRYISEDGTLGRYVSPRLIAEYGDKPTQTYLLLTGQGGIENGGLGENLRQGGGSASGDASQTGRAPESAAGPAIPADLLAGYDWYNNDVERGEAPRLIQVSEHSAPDVDTHTTVQTDPSNVQVQSAEGGQDGGIRGTGAAENNFSGKPAYNAALAEDNAQADRRDDVRPMELPKRDIDGGDVSAVTGNVYGSKITPEEFASLMEEPTAKGDFTYAKITNDQATERAVDTIAQSGDWNTAYSQWVREVDRGAAGAEMTARGALLLNHAAQEGDKGKWLDILSDLQRLGTNTAQGLQAFRIIRTLSAPDRIEFAKMTVRKMVQDLKLGDDIEIDEALLDEYEQAQTEEERDAVLREIQQNVASQIPSTLLDKWTALRYMNMLGNLKTNVRNVMGNVGSSLVYRMKDQIAATMERVTGTQRTKSHTVDRELLTLCKEDFEQFKDAVGSGGKYSDNLSSADQFRQGVMDQRQIFKNPLLEGYRKGTNWMMNNGIFGDEAFGRAAYARALAGFLKANGVTAEQFRQMAADKPKAAGTPKAIIPEGTKVKAADRNNFGTIQKYNKADNTYLVQFVSPQGHTANVTLSADILTPLGKKTNALGPVPKPEQKMEFVDYARAYAIREAQEATFHDNSALAGIVSNIQKTTGVIGQGIMPFTKTPANVLTRAMEFSPLGIIDSTVKTIQAKKNTEISGADIVNSWAKTMTGTGLFALGAAMMDQGLLSGGPDEDEEKAEFDQLNGHQNYALQLPDGTNYTIDWLTPAAMPMFMGAQFWDIANSGGEFSFADMEKVFTSIADPMIQMSMLQGLNDSLDGIKYAENNLGQFFINAAVSYLTQGLTNTLMGQIERSTEENRQTTYIDKNSGTPQWLQRQLGSASQKIPGWDYQQMDYRNAWGQTERNEGGLLYNMLSPGYVSKKQSNAITKELYRLRETTGKNVFPQAVSKTVSYTDEAGTKHVNQALTKTELDTIQRVEGQTAMRLMAEMVVNEDYNQLTDDQRAEVIANVYEYAQEQGKKEALSGYHSEAAAWLRSIGDDAANALIRRAALGSINSAVSNTVDNIENGWAVTPAAQKELDSLYDAYDSMSPEAKKQILDDAISDTAKYLEIRSRGIGTDQYLDVVGDIKGLEVEPNYSSIRDIQIREAIAGNDSLSTKEKDSVMRAYMPDYDPNAKSPQKTELKYDAIRKLGITPQGYTDAYRDYLEASGSGKRRRTIAQYREKYGWDQATATKVYDIYAGSYKPWEE